MKMIIAAMAIAFASPAVAQTGQAAQPQAQPMPPMMMQHGEHHPGAQGAHRCCCEEMMQHMQQGHMEGHDEHSGHEGH